MSKLTDVAIKKAKPEAKSYKMADGGGMYLGVMPDSSKYWRLKYRFGGKEKRLALGVYPEVRRDIMQTWADYLDKVEVDAEVIPMRA